VNKARRAYKHFTKVPFLPLFPLLAIGSASASFLLLRCLPLTVSILWGIFCFLCTAVCTVFLIAGKRKAGMMPHRVVVCALKIIPSAHMMHLLNFHFELTRPSLHFVTQHGGSSF
jgi:hypothetical protein